MSKRLQLKNNDKQAIEQAIESLEKECAGELVVYVAKESDNYTDAIWYLAAVQGIFLSCITLILSYLWMLPKTFGPFELSILYLLVMAIGIALPLFIRRLRVFLMNTKTVQQRVNTRAHDVFVERQIFDTANRIGILFYISAMERQVMVMAGASVLRVTARNGQMPI